MTRLSGSTATPQQSIVIGIILLAIGAVLGVVGVVFANQTLAGYPQMDRAAGRVVEMVQSGKVYKPVVEFAVGGRIYRFTDAQGSQPATYHVGDSVEVVYPPDFPDRARIDSILSTWVAPMLPFACSAIWFITGVFVLRSGTSRMRGQKTVAPGTDELVNIR